MSEEPTKKAITPPQTAAVLSPQKIRTIQAAERKVKEWIPIKELDKLTTPIHQTVSTIALSNKWLQLCLIACIMFAGFQDEPEAFIASFALFFLAQIVYCFIYKKRVDKAEKHYRNYYTARSLPKSEVENYEKIKKAKRQITGVFVTSLFGLIVCVLWHTSLLTWAKYELSHDEDHIYAVFWLLFLPSLLGWSGIHYKTYGLATIVLALVGVCVDGLTGIPITFLVFYTALACMIYTGRIPISSALKFFAVYVTSVLLFVLQAGAIMTNSLGVTIAIIGICFIPTVLVLLLKICLAAADKHVQKDEAGTELAAVPTSDKVMNILYSYIWGGLCTALVMAGIIANFCNEGYNMAIYLVNKSDKIMRNNFESSQQHTSHQMMHDDSLYSDYGSNYRHDNDSNYGNRSYNNDSEYNNHYSTPPRRNRYNYSFHDY